MAAGPLLYAQSKGATLWADEWPWALYRRDNDLNSFLQPNNSHLSLIPVAIYKLLFATAGMDNYAPYRAMVVAAHLVCVTLLFVYARRRVGDFCGLLAAALLLLLGPAWQNVLWPFQVAWLISLAAGVGALLLLDRGDRPGDAGASVLLAVSLSSSGVGVPVALGLVVEVLVGRRRLRDAWIVAAPLTLYVLWWLRYQDSGWIRIAHLLGIKDPLADGISRVPQYVFESAVASTSAVAGIIGKVQGQELESPLTLGLPLVVVATSALIWRLVRLRTFPLRVLTLLTIVLGFWCGTAVTRGFLTPPNTSRYLYVGGLFIVLLAVELARGVHVSRRASALLAVAVAAVVLANLGSFRDGGAFMRSEAALETARLGALELTRSTVDPSYIYRGFPFDALRADRYFAAAKALGSPAATPAEIAKAPEAARLVADEQLIRIHEVVPRAPAGERSGRAPAVELIAGGTVSARGGCVRFRRRDFNAARGPGELRLTAPPAGLLLRADGGPLRVSVRRFADGFQAERRLSASTSAALRIPSDTAALPWRVRLLPEQGATVCGLSQR